MRPGFSRQPVVDDRMHARPFLVSFEGPSLAPRPPERPRAPRAIPIGVILVSWPSEPMPEPLFDVVPDRALVETAAYRTLLPEPGVWRVVQWGEFKPMLAHQIAHADRLHDSHRLPCYAQVYEVTRPQRVESLARAVTGTPEQSAQLRPLTPDIAARLELVPLLPSRRPPQRVPRPEPGVVMPYDRIVRLQVATDPTRGSAPTEQSGAPAERLPADTVREARGRTEIPERLIKPWEFRLSREEAVYDMQAAVPRFPRLAGLRDTLATWFARRGELEKWQALLAGKSRDEQIWAVRPPRGGLSRRVVRDWAARTLELAGYDPRTMLPEWEIFWRRKGL